MATEVWVGTSGFSYKPWKGVFYPKDIADRDMLGHYAQQLRAVEIDNTFYRMPKTSVLESWRGQVPESFRFTIKASRRITHFARLKNTEEPMGFLMGNLRVLGDRLGAVLFQLPPNLPKDLDRLRAFLPLIPEDLPAAFEFRHESWFDPETYGLLSSRGLALCQAETDESPAVGMELVGTTSWGYLRLRRDRYADSDLDLWAERIRAAGWSRALVFFKHEDGAVGPERARALQGRLRG